MSDKILVLYEIKDENSSYLNAFEVPYAELVENERDILLIDLLGFMRNDPVLKALQKHSFEAHVNGKYIPLPSLTSVLPVRNDNTLQLRLTKAFSAPFVPKRQLQAFLDQSRMIYEEMHPYSTRPAQSSSAGTFVREPLVSEQSSAGLGLVSDETVAAISEATEVAKEAARSLFSFAANMSKSVIDSFGASAVNLSTQTALSAGSTLTVGYSKVTITKALAEGGFGMVFAGQLESSRPVALKQLLCQSKEQVTEAHREIDVLLSVRDCPGIVTLLDHCSITVSGQGNVMRQVIMVFPLYARGTAWDAIDRLLYCNGGDSNLIFAPSWPFPEVQALFLAYHTAQTLQYMHDKGFCHRDVKPHNILLTDPQSADEGRLGLGKPILMDLGSAEAIQQVISSKAQAVHAEDEAARKTSLAYRPPELISVSSNCILNGKIDVWSLGCSLYALAFGRSPFESAKEGVQKLGVLNGRYSYPTPPAKAANTYSEGFKRLVDRMLQVDPAQRCSMQEVVDGCASLLANA